MARIQISERVAEDARRFVAHLVEHEARDMEQKIAAIFRAIETLADNPLIGRLSQDDQRELIIGRDSSGYVALYRYDAIDDIVYVLAIRSQREAGYAQLP